MLNAHAVRAAPGPTLRGLLESVPVVRRVSPFSRRRRLSGTVVSGLLVEFRRGGRERWLIDEHSTALKPRTAELAGFEYQQYVVEGLGSYAVIVAPYVSPRSAEILRRAGVGFCDLSGNCRLVSGPVFIERTGFRNAFTTGAEPRSLFTPGAERVLRAVLDPALQGRAWTVRDLAAAAFPGVSLGQAHRIAKLMVEEAFLQRGAAGLVVHEPAKLLEAWAVAYRFGRNRASRFYSPLEPGALIERFRSLGRHRGERGHWAALASFTAASILAPSVRQHRFFTYWRGETAALEGALELRSVDSGENVLIYEPYDSGVFYPYEGAADAVTCPIQTYLDVAASPARGEEAAGAIRERYLTYEPAG